MSETQHARSISNYRIEPWIVGALTLLGTALRAWRLASLGLVHFDEGVYAISGQWTIAPEPQLYAKQVLFSPPLFFSLVGANYRMLGGASDTAALLVNVVIGGLSVALVWWVTRRWFGREAGIASAALVAFSEYHIVYSRMLLTDITFGFLYLLSLASIAATIERASFRWAILSGLAIGAAWNTKYHGWLPLLIALMVLVAYTVFGRRDGSLWKRRLVCWVLIAGVALACYLPWALYVQTQAGGYVSLLKYQRTYVSWRYWLNNLRRQAEMQQYMDGWLSRFSPAVAYLLALVFRRDRWWLGWRAACMTAAVLVGAGFVLSGAGTAVVLAALAVPSLVRRGSHLGWLLLGSLGLLFLITPLYQPYPRLLLPWLLSVYVAAGAGIGWILVDRTVDLAERGSRSSVRFAEVLLAVGVLSFGGLSLVVGFRPTPRTWMATDSVREAAMTMSGTLPKDSMIFVHGGPEVVFYLQLAGRQAIPIDYPIDHPEVTTRFDTSGENVFLVTGIYGEHRDPLSRASLERLKGRLRLVEVFPIQPNDVRLLNDSSPEKALQYRMRPTEEYDLHLYRVDPIPEQTGRP